MLPQETAPHPLLQPYVKCLWRAERDFSHLKDGFSILPDAYVELIISVGASCRLTDGETVYELPNAYLLGLLDKPLRFFADGLVTTYGVRFYAWGFYPLMGYALGQPEQGVKQLDADLSHLVIDLSNVDKEVVIPALHRFLLTRAQKTVNQDKKVRVAGQLLTNSDLGIDALADKTHSSRRQLERRFASEVGVSPKALALRARFEKLRDALAYRATPDLAQVALELGFHDQAHLNREFRRFSGKTPTQFMLEMQAMRELVAAHHDAFLQDA